MKDPQLPPINTIVALTGDDHIYRVGYINPGKKRITLEYVGTLVDDHFLLLSGEKLSPEAFTEYCADRWPVEQPKRTTLQVQNGIMGASGGL